MRFLIRLTVAAVFVTALPLAAQVGKWTAVASTGAIDENSRNHYVTSGPNLQHQATSTTDVVARYNVTNTYGGAINDVAPWGTLQLGYTDNSPLGSVTATLFRVNPCTGTITPICMATSIDNANCVTCATGALNFNSFLYYVEVTVHRVDTTVTPIAKTLRIF